MCFSSSPAAPINKPDYTPDNSQVAVKQTVTDAGKQTTSGGMVAETPGVTSTAKTTGLARPGM